MATVNRTIGADPNMVYESNNTSNKTQGTSQRLKQFQEEEKQIRRLREETYKQDRINEQKLFQYRIANEKEIIKLRQGADSEAYKAAQKLYNTQLKNLLDLNKRKKKSEDETQKAMENMLSETEKKTESISRGFSSMIDSAVKTLNKAYGSFSLSGATDNVANQIAEFRKEFSSYAVNNMDLNSMKDAFSSAISNINSQLGTNYTATDAMNAVRNMAGSAGGLTSLRGMNQQQLQQLIQMNLTGQLTGSGALTQQTSTYLRMGEQGYQTFQDIAGNIAYQQQNNPWFDTDSTVSMLGNRAVMSNIMNGRQDVGQLVSGKSLADLYGSGDLYSSYVSGDLSTRLFNGNATIREQMFAAENGNLINPIGSVGVANSALLADQSLASIAGNNPAIAGLFSGGIESLTAASLANNTVGAANYSSQIADYQGKTYAALQEQGKAEADRYTKSEQYQRSIENFAFDVLPIQSDELETMSFILSGVNEIVKLLGAGTGGLGSIISNASGTALGNILTGSASTTKLFGGTFGKLLGFIGKATPWVAGALALVDIGTKVYEAVEETRRIAKEQVDDAINQGFDGKTTGKSVIAVDTEGNAIVMSDYERANLEAARNKTATAQLDKYSGLEGSKDFANLVSSENPIEAAKSWMQTDAYKQSLASYQGRLRTEEAKEMLVQADSVTVQGGNQSGYATGIYNVGTDGFMAKLHKGEMVLPGPQANYIRAMFGLDTEPVSSVYNDPGYESNVRGIPEFASGAENVGSVSGKTNVHTWFLERLNKLATSYGKNLNVTSGYRSTEYQSKLFADALKKYGSESAARKWVAKPGGSRHETGLAADIDGTSGSGSNSWFRSQANNDILSKFGLWKPLSNENWHVEAIETGYPSLKIRNGAGYSVKDLQNKYGVPGSPTTNTGTYSAGSGGMDEGGTTSAVGSEEGGSDSALAYLIEYSDIPQVANLLAMYDKTGSVDGSTTTQNLGGQYVDNLPDNSAYDSNKFKPILEKYGAQYGINPRLLYGMMMTESSGNPEANKNKNRQYKGLMQINQPKVDSIVGAGANIYDPDVNIHAGAAYLASTIKTTGRTSLGIAGYNTGPGLKIYKTAKQRLDAGGGWDSVSGILSNHEYVEKTYNYAGVPMTPAYLADGGIVTEPTLAMIGEGKPGQSRKNEAVIPLDDSGNTLSDSLGLTDFQDVFTSTMNFNLNSLLAKMDQIIASVVILQNIVSTQYEPMDVRNSSLASFSYR